MRIRDVAITLAGLLLVCMAGHAQPNITRVEYFIDSDPGFGMGTQIPITQSANVNINTTLDLSSISDGFHWFYIRGKDANRRWSVSSFRMFYKGVITSNAPVQTNIIKVEYFFDNDPGFGNGIPVTITPGTSVDVSKVIDVSSLTDGFHWIYLRGMDANRRWSVVSYRLFYKGVLTATAPTQGNIIKAEYFYDTDPGFGKGTAIPITPGTSVNINQTFDASALSEGFHWIYLRGMDTNRRWSVASFRQFYKGTLTTTAPVQTDITEVEYFFDTDPGFGQGIQVPVTRGISVDINKTIDVSALSDGFHKFYIRGKNADGRWNMMSWRYFWKGQYAPSPATSTIKRVEYFIDTDPGYGKATALPFTQGAVKDSISKIIDLGSLSAGTHYFKVRILDNIGRWGYLTSRKFVLDITPPAAPSNLTVTIGNSQVTLDWNSNTDADFLRYRIYKGTQSGNEIKCDSIGGIANSGKVVTGLTNDVNYFFYVTAVDSAKLESLPSNAVSATPLVTAGPPPIPLIASPSELNQFSFRANWNPSPSASKYYIDISTNINFTSYITGYNNKDVGNVTSWEITGLTKNTTYYYRVRAFCVYGTSLSSGTMSATTLLNPPQQPSAPVVIPATQLSQTGFTANWNIAATSTGYRIDVATDETFTSFVTGYNDKDVGNNLNTGVTGLVKYTDYYYRIRAYNQYGTSTNSNWIKVTTWPDPPVPPVAIEATAIASTYFTANWNSVTLSTGYRIDIATDNNFTSFLTGFNSKDVSNTTSCTVTGLTENVTYYYRIRAYNNGGQGLVSNVITVTTKHSAPAAPEAIPASSVSQASFAANWIGVPSADGYRLDVSTANGFTSFVSGFEDRDVSNVISFVVTGLSEDITYYYRIRAYNNGGSGPNSNVISVKTLLTLPDPPGAPVALQPTNLSYTFFTANWNGVATAGGYRLDVATDVNFTTYVAGFNNKDVSNTTSFVITGLTDNVNYFYRVRAYNVGGTSANSNTITLTTPINLPPPPDPPLSAQPTNITQTAFVANWSTSATATGYKIDVSRDIGFTSIVTGYNNKDIGNVTSVSITGLNANTTYFYRVRASNAGGTSNNSVIISITTLPYPPVAPSGITVQSCEYLVTLSWTANTESDFYRYRIYAGKNANPTTQIDSTTAGNQSDVTKIYAGLEKGETYYFRIRAVSLNGLASDFSTGVSIKVIKGVTPVIKSKWSNILICYNKGDSLASYQWYKNGSSISGASGQYFVSNKQPGSYYVISTDKNNCKDTSNIVSISGGSSLRIWPNPSLSKAMVSINSEITGTATIRIISESGLKAAEYKFEKPDYEFEKEIVFHNLLKGIYTIEVLINGDEIDYTKLVIIK